MRSFGDRKSLYFRLWKEELCRPQTVSRLARATLSIALVSLGTLSSQAQLIVNGTHTITTNSDGTDLVIDQEIRGKRGGVLNIEGAGRVTLKRRSGLYYGKIYIRGSEFRNPHDGHIQYPEFISIENGGTLVWDNSQSSSEIDHFADGYVVLGGGALQVIGRSGSSSSDAGEGFGGLSLIGGANTIYIQNNDPYASTNIELYSNHGFNHVKNTATLNLSGNKIYAGSNQRNSVTFRYQSNIGSINGVVPWATMNGETLVSELLNSGTYYLIPIAYDTVGQSNWNDRHNISIDSGTVLTDNRTINSLRLEKTLTAALNLGGNSLTLSSGGLLSTGDKGQITGEGEITTASNRPLYAHVYGDELLLEDKAALTGDIDLVKTGPGELILDSDATHSLGEITINEGIIRLLKGGLSVVGDILIGDGAGMDALELAANLNNPIVKTSSRFPNLTLHGNPYKPSTDAAILRFGRNTRQQLDTLHIQARGILEFATNSTQAAPSILYLDRLTFDATTTRFIIRNWKEQADYLLVKRSWGDANVPPLLNRIVFEGYGAGALWRAHALNGFDDYWQITPLPEPSTYGLILGAVSLGLFVIKRRRRHSRLGQ